MPDAAAAVGNGPCRAVLRAGVRLILQAGLFAQHGEFYNPLFYPLDFSTREADYWVAGYWSALHILILGVLPDPITPWLFYASVYEKAGLPLNIDYIHALDPTLANELEPWFNFRAGDILQAHDHMNPVRQLLINRLEIHDVSSLTRAVLAAY
jgi:hypothetical protein